MALSVWTVAELGAFYTEHRSELLSHANRVLKDSAKAEEITQDSLIKFMLAAPELESSEHALSYLHRTIENLCIDYFRMEGRRPNLVVLDDAQAEVEAAWQVSGDHSAVLSQAEDAAIIRQALALLSPAERAALVMWEMEGRSTSEIAAELGIKESAVRHTVSRARTSLRRILSELVIDHERGLTALDMLSTTYKKAADLAAKSSKVALSLLLVVTAFLGFNSLTGREGVLPTATTQEPTAKVAAPAEATEAASPAPSISMPAKKSSTMVSGVFIKGAKATWPGLDSEGLPTAFTVTGENGTLGKIRINRNIPEATEQGTILATQAITYQGGPNVSIDQSITVDGNGTKYEVQYVSFGINGVWAVAEARATSVDFERMSNGQYLTTVTISLLSTPTSELSIPVGNRGYDVVGAPKTITTRLLLNASKTQILAQAILIPEPAQKAKG
ncbi:RNA polymerase sigma factor [Candidatus Planktophila versatilis]|uniref:RNA polymerase subunit sigma-24 n=1 Tax=Candidatus Planktophila versatilis TaxID=1884905 RepID=A0ABN5BDW6_9ACTN|nr:RNA polymerase sigma factor [Candidatus Planktophila versatilis]ASY16707.1 RNA polymerase subunit sigma-24 [Candidatus Planktophila versatilis]